MNNVLALLLTAIFSLSTFAIPQMDQEMVPLGKESHGGDNIAFEFIESARRGFDILASSPQSKLPISATKLKLSLNKISIMTTARELKISRDGNTQFSTAINYISDNGVMTVVINSNKWNKTSTQDRYALAVHEVLCLHGIEKTYDYTYSSEISSSFLELQKRYGNYNCSSELNDSNTKVAESIHGSFEGISGVRKLRFFYDIRERRMKYLFELDSFIGNFTSSSKVEFCTKRDSVDQFITFEGSMHRIQVNGDSIKVQKALKVGFAQATDYVKTR